MTAGEAGDILCRYKKNYEGEKVTVDLVGFFKYSSVSFHREMALRH